MLNLLYLYLFIQFIYIYYIFIYSYIPGIFRTMLNMYNYYCNTSFSRFLRIFFFFQSSFYSKSFYLMQKNSAWVDKKPDAVNLWYTYLLIYSNKLANDSFCL